MPSMFCTTPDCPVCVSLRTRGYVSDGVPRYSAILHLIARCPVTYRAPSTWSTRLDTGERNERFRPRGYAAGAAVVWARRRIGMATPPGEMMRQIVEAALRQTRNGWRPRAHGAHAGREVRAWLAERTEQPICERCDGYEGFSCECSICAACGEKCDSTCDHCDRCESCCSCARCAACGDRVDDLCSECERCSDCCACADEREYHPARVKFHGEPDERFPRYVSAEIEGYNLDERRGVIDLCRTWNADLGDDGSIDGEHTFELATAPARGEAFTRQIEQLTRALGRGGAEVDTSCGLHVHVDARDLKIRQLLTLVKLYSKLEVGLYSVVAPSRWGGSSYCKPWGATFEIHGVHEKRVSDKDREKRLDVAVYGSEEEAWRAKASKSKHESRYHGLNLNALIVHGTIEFRLHHGTVNCEKIVNWAQVCSALVEWSATHREADVDKLTGSSFEALLKVVKDRRIVKWLKERRAHFNGVRRLAGAPALEDDPQEAVSEESEA